MRRENYVNPYDISFFYDTIADKYRIFNGQEQLSDCTALRIKEQGSTGRSIQYSSLYRFLRAKHKNVRSLSLKNMINSDLNDDMKRFCDMDVSQNLNHQLINSNDGKSFLARNPHLKGLAHCAKNLSILEERKRKNDELSRETIINYTCMASGVATLAPIPWSIPAYLGDAICTGHYIQHSFNTLDTAEANRNEMTSCLTRGSGSCSAEELDNIYQGLSNAQFDANLELGMSVLFFAGALHDLKNTAHYLKFSVAHKGLMKAMKSGLTNGEAIDEVRKVMSELFGFEVSEGLIKQFVKATKTGDSKNRFRILRELAFEKISPKLKEEVFGLLVHNPEIIDLLKSGLIRGDLRFKRSFLRNLFENQKALTEFVETLSSPEAKSKFIKMIQLLKKSSNGVLPDEKVVIEKIHAFFKARNGVDELLKVIDYNIRLLKPLGRTRAIAGYLPKHFLKLAKWAYENVRGVKEYKNILAKLEAIRASLVELPKHIEEVINTEIGKVMNERSNIFNYKKAKELLEKIEKDLESPAEFLFNNRKYLTKAECRRNFKEVEEFRD